LLNRFRFFYHNNQKMAAHFLNIISPDLQEYKVLRPESPFSDEDRELMEEGEHPEDVVPFEIIFYVLEQHGHDVGHASLSFFNLGETGRRRRNSPASRKLQTGGTHMWITNFVVEPEGIGIGREVLKYLQQHGFTAETYGGETDEGKGFWRKMHEEGLIE
jgi:hypothetical protein